MAEQGHTPTPWKADGYDIRGRITVVAHADTEENAAWIVRACNSHDALVAVCERVVACLDRLAEHDEEQAKNTRFETLRDSCRDAAKNYRATAADVRKALSTATPPEAGD